MGSWPKQDCSKPKLKPNLKLYFIITKNETTPVNADKSLYTIEGILVNNFNSNKQIGTAIITGTNTHFTSNANELFYNEVVTLQLPQGTITSVAAGVNETQENGIFIASKAPIITRIITGSGKYALKNGFNNIKVVDDIRRKLYIYFTK
jgi:hypothetical protein